MCTQFCFLLPSTCTCVYMASSPRERYAGRAGYKQGGLELWSVGILFANQKSHTNAVISWSQIAKTSHYIPCHTLNTHKCTPTAYAQCLRINLFIPRPHSAGTHCWDTVLGQSAGTQCWDTLLGHSAGTYCWNTVLEHSADHTLLEHTTASKTENLETLVM